MASVFVRHQVTDYDKWREVFDADQARRLEYGVKSYSLHRTPVEPNLVIVALRVDDLQKAAEFLGGPETTEKMKDAGVEGIPEMWLGEDVGEG